jgi:hypothetical protein
MGEGMEKWKLPKLLFSKMEAKKAVYYQETAFFVL